MRILLRSEVIFALVFDDDFSLALMDEVTLMEMLLIVNGCEWISVSELETNDKLKVTSLYLYGWRSKARCVLNA